jgi:hypothetical protein
MKLQENNTLEIISSKCGFGVSLLGEQKWPVRVVVVKQTDLTQTQVDAIAILDS